MKIPKQYQKYKVQSNKTWTTHVIEFWNKRQLQDLYTSAHEIKRGNIHEEKVEIGPTKINISDSCPLVLGGISIHGWYCRYHIPRTLQGRNSNNILEYIAEIIIIWVDIIEGHMNKEIFVLALSGSYIAIEWTCKSNFDKVKQSAQFISARC